MKFDLIRLDNYTTESENEKRSVIFEKGSCPWFSLRGAYQLNNHITLDVPL